MTEGNKTKRMTLAELAKIAKNNLNITKVIELSRKIKVNKTGIEQEITPDTVGFPWPAYDVVYQPLYDTTYKLKAYTKLFSEPIGPTEGGIKSYKSTNMVTSAHLPLPQMFIVKGFSITTDIPIEKLKKLIMRFQVIAKVYAEMPLNHMPYEYPDNRIIIPAGGYFSVEIQNELEEVIKDELVFFLNGWIVRAVQ